jgi:hypothetical protein
MTYEIGPETLKDISPFLACPCVGVSQMLSETTSFKERHTRVPFLRIRRVAYGGDSWPRSRARDADSGIVGFLPNLLGVKLPESRIGLFVVEDDALVWTRGGELVALARKRGHDDRDLFVVRT